MVIIWERSKLNWASPAFDTWDVKKAVMLPQETTRYAICKSNSILCTYEQEALVRSRLLGWSLARPGPIVGCPGRVVLQGKGVPGKAFFAENPCVLVRLP